MAMPLMTQTLPTVIGAGIVARTTETMFDRGGRRGGSKSRGRASSRRPASAKRPRATIIVGASPTRFGAENYATGYRRALRREGKPYVGKVKVKKVSGGYVAVHMRG